MIDHIQRYTIPAAYALLPPEMESDHATAMLLAIGLQESGFLYRAQAHGGPARGFWQFEVGGIAGVLRHARTREPLYAALTALRYDGLSDRIASCYKIVEHSDTLAAVFARCLLWTLPLALPSEDEPDRAWLQYLDAWRPGKPRRETWDAWYRVAWDRVLNRREEHPA
jgi:hypothetical protein